MKRMHASKVNSSNSDLHFVWEETTELYSSKTKKALTEAKAKEITKIDAPQLLFITREE